MRFLFSSPVRLLISRTLCILLLSCGVISQAQTTASCSFSAFQAPSGYSLEAPAGINNYGTIVGSIFSPPTGNTGHEDAFIHWSDGKTNIYSYSGAADTWFSKRNDSGLDVGTYQDKGGHLHGLVVSGSNAVTVNYPAGSGATDVNTQLSGINKFGSMVGSYSAFVNGNFANSGFELKNKAYTKISYPGSTRTIPLAINAKGYVVGYYNTGSLSQPNPFNHGFILQNGTYRTLDDPQGKSQLGTRLQDMNTNGVIVGNYVTQDSKGNTESHGFIYQTGSFKNVVYPGARSTWIAGINDYGTVVGSAVFSANTGLGYTMKPFKAYCH